MHSSIRLASWIYGGILETGRAVKEGTWGGEEMGGGKERGVHPFQHLPRSLQATTTNLNENHRLDSDLSKYNKLGGITLGITEMATH